MTSFKRNVIKNDKKRRERDLEKERREKHSSDLLIH